MRMAWHQIKTTFRRIALPKRCTEIRRQNLAKQATSKGNTQERRELPQPKANAGSWGAASLITILRPLKAPLSAVLQNRVKMIQGMFSSATIR